MFTLEKVIRELEINGAYIDHGEGPGEREGLISVKADDFKYILGATLSTNDDRTK